jgi:hypothetical protein
MWKELKLYPPLFLPLPPPRLFPDLVLVVVLFFTPAFLPDLVFTPAFVVVVVFDTLPLGVFTVVLVVVLLTPAFPLTPRVVFTVVVLVRTEWE